MKQVTLNVQTRKASGTSAANRLRRSGQVPAVIYGESGVRHLQLSEQELNLAYRKIIGSAALLELKSDDHDAVFAIIQDMDRDATSDRFLHVDFKEIVRGREMEADIPVHTVGTPFGVKEYGGVLETSTNELRVRCRPRDLPEFIEVNVRELNIGDSIHLGELTAPEGVTFLDDSDLVIAACVGATKSVEDEEAEAEAEAAAAAEAEEGEEGEEAEGEEEAEGGDEDKE